VEGVTNVIDGDVDSYWRTYSRPHAHELTLSLGSEQGVGAIHYLPRQSSSNLGSIADYEIYVSDDGVSWGQAVTAGTLTETGNAASIIGF